MPAAYLPAREAIRQAERAVRAAADATAEPVPAAATAPRLRDRILGQFLTPSANHPRFATDPVEERRASRHEAFEKAEEHLAEAKRDLARIEKRHDGEVTATENYRMERLAKLDHRIALTEAAVDLLGGAEDWTVRGVLALMRAARQALRQQHQDSRAIEDNDPADEPPVTGPRFR